MKMQILYDTQREINRLFIAGSRFAAGDPRLIKLIPVFEKMGEKVPVFKKIATDLQDLTQVAPQESSAKLLALGTLLYSILYTQGETQADPINHSAQQPVLSLKDVQTRAMYSELAVMREASSAKSGRLELVRAAHEQGIFTDFRTFPFLDSLLEDRYAELVDYVETTIIPAAGVGMICILRKRIELDDKIANVRRLRALIRLQDPELQALIDAVYAQSLPDMQAAAVAFLARDIKNEDFLLALAGDRKKIVRENALLALMELGSVRALELIGSAIKDAADKKNKTFLLACLGNYQQKYGTHSLSQQLRDFYETEK